MQFRRIEDFIHCEREFFERQIANVLYQARRLDDFRSPRINTPGHPIIDEPGWGSPDTPTQFDAETIYNDDLPQMPTPPPPPPEIPDSPESPTPSLDLILPDSDESSTAPPSPRLLIPNREEFGTGVVEISDVESENDDESDDFVTKTSPCSICYASLANRPLMATQCGHVFHRVCLLHWLCNNISCPLCRSVAMVGECINIHL